MGAAWRARCIAIAGCARSCFVVASCMAGCIIPPSLSVDVQDASIDSPPSITSVRSDLAGAPRARPGVVRRRAGCAGVTINLTLLDTDIGDTLYANIYIDYNPQQPTNARSECLPAVLERRRRSDDDLLGIRDLPAVGYQHGADHIMEIVVFDREPLKGSAQPQFKAIPPDGQSTTRIYLLNCSLRIMKLCLAIALATAACLQVPEAPKPECTTDSDCETSLGEVCNAGTCYGGPPPGNVRRDVDAAEPSARI